MLVSEIMSRDLIVLRERDTIARAGETLEQSWVRHLPVVDGANRLVGLVTHRDVSSTDEDLDTPLGEIMTVDLKTIGPGTKAHEAAYLLLRHSIGCVPVTEPDGTLVGLLTEADFVRIAYGQLGGCVSVDEIEREERDAENV